MEKRQAAAKRNSGNIIAAASWHHRHRRRYGGVAISGDAQRVASVAAKRVWQHHQRSVTRQQRRQHERNGEAAKAKT